MKSLQIPRILCRKKNNYYLENEYRDGFILINNFGKGRRLKSTIDIENVAVNQFSLIISKTGYLVAHIPTKDRGPSFDGYVCVYNHPEMNHEKNDMDGIVNVQVKGKVVNINHFSQSYPVEISDLKAFLKSDGTLLLVAFSDANGEDIRLYYSRLLPYELKEIIKECDEHQKRKSIKLIPFPTEQGEISDLFINFVSDSQKQKSYVESSFNSDEYSLRNDNDTLSFGYITSQSKYLNRGELPFSYLFTHGIYLYKDIGYNLKMPVQYIEKFNKIFGERSGIIISDGKEFYKSFKQCFTLNHIEITIGKSHKIILNKKEKTLKYKYNLSGNLKEKIIDEKFFLSILKSKSISINGNSIPLEIERNADGKNADVDIIQRHIEWMEKLDKALEMIGSKVPLVYEKLTEQDEANIYTLIEGIVEKNLVHIKIGDSPFGFLSFCNQKILLCAIKKDKGKYELYSYYDAPLIYRGLRADKTEFDCSYYVLLKKEEMIATTNIDLARIINEVKKISLSPDYLCRVNMFLLELIKVYDENQNEEYFKNAKVLAKWLQEKEHDENMVSTLNCLQLKKRKTPLTRNEKNILQSFENATEDLFIRIGTNILLERFNKAQELFVQLNDFEKNEFRNFPICKLWNGFSLNKL